MNTEGRQADRLQGDALAPRVRSRNDQDPGIASQREIQRNHIIALMSLQEQRMSCLPKRDHGLVDDPGSGADDLDGIPSPGDDKVEFADDIHCFAERPADSRHLRGQFPQDSFDLPDLPELQLAQCVIQIQRLGRFYKDRGSAR